MQTTLRRSIFFSGVGLHSGRPVRMALRPAPAGHGVRFCRIDVSDRDQIVRARFDAVDDARLCTRLANDDGVSVSTVEHLMAALAGLGVDNVLVDIDGPEAPILDGSAAPFVREIKAAGLVADAAPRRALRILETVSVSRGDASATLHPADAFSIAFEIDFAAAAIGRQSVALEVTPASFAAELADCRTFVERREIEALRAAGLARGGDLRNAVVVDGDRVLTPGGLRRADECVRHKALDAVGDLALAGGPVIGRYVGVKAGHALTNQLLRKLFDTPSAWTWVEVEAEAAPLLARVAAE
jgi:UDP-3-O-[3-hydroxymyristoyl] N-acetylglucosamine deacetylase